MQTLPTTLPFDETASAELLSVESMVDNHEKLNAIVYTQTGKYVRDYKVLTEGAFGDQYRAFDFVVPGPGKLTVKFTPADGGEPLEREVFDYPDGGVAMTMYNLDESIRGFARACMNYALVRRWPVYLSTKNTMNTRCTSVARKVSAGRIARSYGCPRKIASTWSAATPAPRASRADSISTN